MRFQKLLFTIIVAATALTVMTCSQGSANGQTEAQGAKKSKPPAVPVAVTTPSRGDISAYYESTATLEAEATAVIHARTAGVVEALVAEEGQIVEEGDVLLRIEDDTQKLRVLQAELALERQQIEHQRRLKMRDSGVLPEQEFETSENDLKQAEAELASAKLQLRYTQVRAPFAGVIVKRLVDLGQNVGAGDEIYHLMDVNPLLVKVHIPANRLGTVSVGHRLHLTLDTSNQEMEARVKLVSPIVDPDTGTVKVTAEIYDYPKGTRPGDFARVRVVTDHHADTLLLPSVAVIEEQGRHFVYTVVDGKAKRITVQTGFQEDGRTEITEGLNGDEPIVVKGQRNLRDGLAVAIAPDKKDAALADREDGKTEAML